MPIPVETAVFVTLEDGAGRYFRLARVDVSMKCPLRVDVTRYVMRGRGMGPSVGVTGDRVRFHEFPNSLRLGQGSASIFRLHTM